MVAIFGGLGTSLGENAASFLQMPTRRFSVGRFERGRGLLRDPLSMANNSRTTTTRVDDNGSGNYQVKLWCPPRRGRTGYLAEAITACLR